MNASDNPNTNYGNSAQISVTRSATTNRNAYISWNISKVTATAWMFMDMNYNQPLNTWTPIAVTDMSGMFWNNDGFNQPLNTWNTSSVTNMYGMFQSAGVFNQNISTWNVTNVTNWTYFHSGAPLTQANCPPKLW